jgi:hypothetical protein
MVQMNIFFPLQPKIPFHSITEEMAYELEKVKPCFVTTKVKARERERGLI